MSGHFAINYIGKDYIPEVYDCWVFVRDVYRREYGIDLDPIDINADNIRDVLRIFRDTDEFSNWVEVDTPIEGDVVLLGQSKHPIHVGIWIAPDGGGLLHCVKGRGVIFQSYESLIATSWNIKSYWRHRSKR